MMYVVNVVVVVVVVISRKGASEVDGDQTATPR